jgi:hypothetical protein
MLRLAFQLVCVGNQSCLALGGMNSTVTLPTRPLLYTGLCSANRGTRSLQDLKIVDTKTIEPKQIVWKAKALIFCRHRISLKLCLYWRFTDLFYNGSHPQQLRDLSIAFFGEFHFHQRECQVPGT